MKTRLLILLCCTSLFVQAQLYNNNTAVTIPDGTSGTCWAAPGTAGNSVISVPVFGIITNPTQLTIGVRLAHTWMGDLRVELVAPDNSTCVLINRLGPSGCGSNNNFNGANTLSFNVTNPSDVPNVNNVPSGNYRPTVGVSGVTACNMGSFLTGKSLNGNWALRATDGTLDDFGQITAWSFNFTGATLPVTLRSFDATKIGDNKVVLSWRVEEQIRIRYYVIERSMNGVDFSPIGVVQATTATQHTYNYTDLTPFNGFNYYRLRVVEFAGPDSYSLIRQVRIAVSNSISVLGNPFDKNIELVVYREAASVSAIHIYDLSGKVLYRRDMAFNAGANPFTINADTWASGVYTMIVTEKTGERQRSKLIKK
jgi:subtilisin-like proprotein convertase family protein